MLNLIESSTEIPVPLDDVKINQLRIEHDEEDQHITDLIHAADNIIEKTLGRSFKSQTWELVQQSFCMSCNHCCCRCEITLPYPPLESIEFVKYHDADDVLITLNPDEYFTVVASENKGLIQAKKHWPSTNYYRPNAVQVRFVTKDCTDNPVYVHLLKNWVTLLYQERTGEISKQEAATIDRLENLLRVYC